MSSDAPIQADPYLSSKEAGKLLGYTHDYISKLCREGKMAGIQRGRVWFVTEEEVRAFQVRHEAELEQKKAQLSEKFSAIRMEHESVRNQDIPTHVATVVEPPAEIFAVSMPIEEQEPVHSETTVQSVPGPVTAEEVIEDYEEEPVQKTIQFAMPKHFAAVAVLALLLLAPSLMNNIQAGTKGAALAQSIPSVPASAIVENLDSGIATVLSAQAELVSRTANTFSFLQYLSDGYWELAMSTTQMCKDFYGFLKVVSNGYLAVYVLHGQILYDSFGRIDNMGATVLQGYELVGKSFVIGSQNVADMFRDFFMVDSYVDSLKKN